MSEARCERCGAAPAVVRVTRLIRGTPIESHLCDRCADPPLGPEEAGFRCPRCGKDYAPDDVKALFADSPPPAPLDEQSFREWQSRIRCRICQEPFFPQLSESVLDFLKEYALQKILRHRRPPANPGPT